MATENEISQYKVIFKSTPNAIDFAKLSIRSFPKIVIMSDVFKFFPYGELYFSDPGGIIIDKLNFVEGLKLEFKIGNDEVGYVGQNFSWAESQVNNTKIVNYISGDNVFIMKSYLDRIDRKKSRAWSSYKLSNVAKEIAQKDFGLTDTAKLHISDTMGSDFWYQTNITNRNFLFDHRERAYSQVAPNSPYLTFINSNEEFYFSTIESLFSEQQPVASFKLDFSDTAILQADTIKGYDITFVGDPLNKPNYKRKMYILDKSGVYASTDNLIQDFFVKAGKGKTLITRDLQDNPTSIDFLGIKETAEDEYRLNGKRNFKFLDSVLPVRMQISLFFNPLCVSGKLVDLKIESSFESKQILNELSGNWLILSDTHFMDWEGIATTTLTIAKSKIQVDTDNPFYNDFL